MGSHLPESIKAPKADMFVEFAHIYADDVWGQEHHRSVEVMRDYLDRESTPESLVVSAILIDDLHIKANTLDVTAFVRQILRRGLAPDHIVFEGRLAPVAETIIHALPGDSLVWDTFRGGRRVLSLLAPNGRRIGLKSVQKHEEQHTCALLSAAWSLCRAGVCAFPQDAIIRLTEAPTVGQRIVSVLHQKYQGVEAKVLDIIGAIGHEDLVPRLELVFFQDSDSG